MKQRNLIRNFSIIYFFILFIIMMNVSAQMEAANEKNRRAQEERNIAVQKNLDELREANLSEDANSLDIIKNNVKTITIKGVNTFDNLTTGLASIGFAFAVGLIMIRGILLYLAIVIIYCICWFFYFRKHPVKKREYLAEKARNQKPLSRKIIIALLIVFPMLLPMYFIYKVAAACRSRVLLHHFGSAGDAPRLPDR